MPKIVVLAGINGAGKTTASEALVREYLEVGTFVNADTIARGLNAFNVESVAMQAGRLMLDRLDELAADRKDFAFETTLAGRAYHPWLKKLKESGYEIVMYYYWLRSPAIAVQRVAARVRSGGHDVPEATIRQRYARSVSNFIDLYRPLLNYWEVYDNSNGLRIEIAIGNETETLTFGNDLWRSFDDSRRTADQAK
jgi:predicted ABC-type ATPase